MKLHIIAAVAQNGVIGKLNALPWRLSGDLKNFKQMTDGHTVLMGRKTWESIPNAPLKNRTNLVLTSQATALKGATILPNYETFVKYYTGRPGDCFIMGGRSVYERALQDPKVRVMHITRIYNDVDGDTSFPSFDEKQWLKVNMSPIMHDNGLDYRFIDYLRYEAGQCED